MITIARAKTETIQMITTPQTVSSSSECCQTTKWEEQTLYFEFPTQVQSS